MSASSQLLGRAPPESYTTKSDIHLFIKVIRRLHGWGQKVDYGADAFDLGMQTSCHCCNGSKPYKSVTRMINRHAFDRPVQAVSCISGHRAAAQPPSMLSFRASISTALIKGWCADDDLTNLGLLSSAVVGGFCSLTQAFGCSPCKGFCMFALKIPCAHIHQACRPSGPTYTSPNSFPFLLPLRGFSCISN